MIFSDLVYTVTNGLRKNKGTILTVCGCVGVVATGVLSVNAGIKAADIWKEYQEEKKKSSSKYDQYYAQFNNTEVDKKKIGRKIKSEAAKKLFPIFVPCILSTGATIVCIIFSDVSNKKVQAALTAAYISAAKSLEKYKKAIADESGYETVDKIDKRIADENYILNSKEIEKPPENCADKMLYYDSFTGKHFWMTEAEVLEAEYELNRMFALRGWVTLNDWLESVGLDPVPEGNVLGWDQYIGEVDYGYRWIDFEHKYYSTDQSDDCDIPPYCVISFPFAPHPEGFSMEAETRKLHGI